MVEDGGEQYRGSKIGGDLYDDEVIRRRYQSNLWHYIKLNCGNEITICQERGTPVGAMQTAIFTVSGIHNRNYSNGSPVATITISSSPEEDHSVFNFRIVNEEEARKFSVTLPLLKSAVEATFDLIYLVRLESSWPRKREEIRHYWSSRSRIN